MSLWLEMLERERNARVEVTRDGKNVTVRATGLLSGITTDKLSGDLEDEDLYIGQMLGELMVLEAKALEDRIREGVVQAENGLTIDRGDFSEHMESDPDELCRCGHAARVHTMGAGNCLALGGSDQEDSHCLEFHPFALPVKTVGEQIAYNIRAELVCCDVYGRVHDQPGLSKAARTVLLKTERDARNFHSICFWGEASARIAESFR